MQIDAEMQVVSHSKAGFAGFADHLFLLDLLADLDVHGAQMRIERKQAKPMIDDHGVAVDSQIADESDDAAVGGFRRVIFRDGQVVTDVISVVDRFGFVSVGSGVRKIRLDFGIGELIKGAVPENRRGGFLGDRPDLVFVLFAKVFICLLYTSPSPRDRQKSRMPSSA